MRSIKVLEELVRSGTIRVATPYCSAFPEELDYSYLKTHKLKELASHITVFVGRYALYHCYYVLRQDMRFAAIGEGEPIEPRDLPQLIIRKATKTKNAHTRVALFHILAFQETQMSIEATLKRTERQEDINMCAEALCRMSE